MAADLKPRIKAPASASPGEVVTVKTLIAHPMENGRRMGEDGALVPRRIIHTLRASFEGETVFEAELGPSVAANPYVEFGFRVTRPGTLSVVWIEDGGDVWRAEQVIELG